MRDELKFHLEQRVSDLVASGLPEQEARRQARLEFGSADRVGEECREASGLAGFDAFARNVRFSLRLLRRDPAFAVTSILTLALCVGANTAVFSLVDAVLVRPLPYVQPDRLAQVVTLFRHQGVSGEQVSQTGLVWETLRDQVGGVRPAAEGLVTGVNLAGSGRVENVRQARVSAGYFSVLGADAALGREFNAEEDRPGGPPVAVLSHELWQRMFTGDRAILGSRVFLRGEPHTVVGILPKGFRSPSRADVWTPLRPSRTGEGGGSNYQIIARLRDGTTWAQAEAEVGRAGADIFRGSDVPQGAEVRLHLSPLQRSLTSDVRRPLLLIWGAVALVLLIGCANIASLQLARGATRTREIATRMALGGGRRALVSQLLTENLVLALAGGLTGLLLGYAILQALEQTVTMAFDLWQPIALNLRVLLLTLLSAVVCVLLFGLIPAFRIARVDVRGALSEGGARGVAGGARQWPRRVLVVGQVALGLTLLMAAGLLVRTVTQLYSQPPGFDLRQVASASVSLQDSRYTKTESMTRLFDRSLEGIRRLPGVESAGVGLTLPYERALNLGFRVEDGRTNAEVSSLVYVTPGFFETLRMPIRRGRAFEGRDLPQAAPVAIVNEAFARRFMKGRDPLTTPLRVSGAVRTIVGVVGDVQQRAGWGDFGPIAPVPCIYLPASQMPDAGMSMIHTWFSPHWVVRTSAPVSTLLPELQRELATVDPLLPFAGFRTMEEVRAETFAGQRVRAQVLGGLGVLALILTAVGLYGVVASGVTARTQELAIRLALGSSRGAVVKAVVVPGLVFVTAGAVLGAGLSRLAVPALRGLIWGIPLFDPITIVGVFAAMIVVAGTASLLPAIRVIRLDPARVLRND